jgi:hypothetical protein
MLGFILVEFGIAWGDPQDVRRVERTLKLLQGLGARKKLHLFIFLTQWRGVTLGRFTLWLKRPAIASQARVNKVKASGPVLPFRSG